MVESLMLIALGFLTATLFALIAIQLVWRRAVKVTTKRLEGELNAEEARYAADQLADVESRLHESQQQVQALGEHLTGVEAQLQESQQDVVTLGERKAEVEQALAHAGEEAQSLRDEIAALHARHDAARADAELHARNVAALRARVADLEAAASAEIARQGEVATQLKSLGEKAARLVYEMNEVFGHATDAHGLETAVEPAVPAAPAVEAAVAPARLSPFPMDDEPAGDDLRELEEIKASLSSFGEGSLPEETEEESDEPRQPLPNEGFLAERIRALEAGVAS